MGAEADEHETMEHASDYELAHRVSEALKSVKLGDTSEYDQIIGILHHNECLEPEEVAMLMTILSALTRAIPYIDFVHHRLLLSSICKMSFWNYGPNVMDALAEFVVALAALTGKYLDLCLDMLVSNFIPPHNFLTILKQAPGQAKKDLVLSRVHSALKAIADLVPLAPSRLEKIVRERVPNAFSMEPASLSHNRIAVYVENMLMLESGDMGEFVGNHMVFELVNRLTDMDLEIGLDEILLDASKEGIFVREPQVMEQPPQREYSGRIASWRVADAQKLDTLMDLTLDHIQSCFINDRLVQVFEALLQSFQKTVLNAHKSKFVQFVMFYACSLDPEDCGTQFVSRLVEIFENTIHPQQWRMTAVAYLASYLSRAKFLSASYVTIVLERLVYWCYKYCETNNGSETNPENHRVFYAGCQAIMYILCFRMRSILDLPLLKSQLFNMPLERILTHALNPLEVCLPTVVAEFLSQVRAVQLFHVPGFSVSQDLLESEASRAFGGIERLDLLFPFDPYLLEKSDRFIRPNFIYWSMVRTTYDDDEEDDDDDEMEAEDGVSDGGGPMSYEDGEFDMNSSKMSIMPPNFMFGNEGNPRMQMPSRIRPLTSPEFL